MVHFSGKARKMNHLSSFCASEASAKVLFNAHFEFMYGFRFLQKLQIGKSSNPICSKFESYCYFCLFVRY
ncbi:MAG: hypothetical protein U5L45_03355 [Saprospiraceae bacterium]|nr:hypothetical protein [Saprospiraceae bacterium]